MPKDVNEPFARLDEQVDAASLPFPLTCARREAAKITSKKKRLEFVRDFIASIPEDNFNMGDWHGTMASSPVAKARRTIKKKHYCGTVACIGGWTELLFAAPAASGWYGHKAPSLLGLSQEDAQELFYPHALEDSLEWNQITNAQAVRVIDHFLATGKVDWTIILEENNLEPS
jgi:hypothetical protein